MAARAKPAGSRRLYLAAAALAAAIAAAPADAQTLSTGATEPTAILTINPERLFEETAFGRRVQRELETIAQDLSAENRRIEAELNGEEQDLTDRRPGLSIEEFRALADAFDTKVDRIREEQDAKERDLLRRQEMERQRFFGQIGPVLTQILQERNAAVVLDRRNVFISTESADITALAIGRIDAAIGDGAGDPATSPDQGTSD